MNDLKPLESKYRKKYLNEKGRKNSIDSSIEQLRDLICKNEEEKKRLKWVDILPETVKYVYGLNAETSGSIKMAEHTGFIDAFRVIENETIVFMQRHHFSQSMCREVGIDVGKVLENERDSLFAHIRNSPNVLVFANNSQDTVFNAPGMVLPRPKTSEARIEMRKVMQKYQRDRMTEAYRALERFLLTFNVNTPLRTVLYGARMVRIQILESTIQFIRNKRNELDMNNLNDYRTGFICGFAAGLLTAVNFFKRHHFLCEASAALEHHLKFTKYSPIAQVANQMNLSVCRMPQYYLQPFKTSPASSSSSSCLTPLSSNRSFGSSFGTPLSNTDTSPSSSSSTPSFSMSPKKMWRPWE